MSNHFSAAYMKFPGDDARLDLTDLFVFASAGSPGHTVLIMDVNPFMMGLNAVPPFLLNADFHPDGVYRINVDNDGDNQADAAFTFTFSQPRNDTQTGTAGRRQRPQTARRPAGRVSLPRAARPLGPDRPLLGIARG